MTAGKPIASLRMRARRPQSKPARMPPAGVGWSRSRATTSSVRKRTTVKWLSVVRNEGIVTSTGQQALSSPAKPAAGAARKRWPSTTTRSGSTDPISTCARRAASVPARRSRPSKKGAIRARVPRRPPHVGLEGGVGIVLVGAAVHEVPGERAIVIGVGAERLLHVEPGEEEDAEPERQGPQGDEAESAARPEPRLPAAHRPHAARTASVRPYAFQAVPGQTVDSRIAPGFRASRDAAEVRAGG